MWGCERIADEDVTVIITLMDNPTVVDTIDSLLRQTMKPRRIIVADASHDNVLFDKIKKYGGIVEVYKIFGSIVESRSKTFFLLKQQGNDDVKVFIDSDEVAPMTWLEKLVKPIFFGQADFTFGPRKNKCKSRSSLEKYIEDHNQKLYGLVDQSFFGMGNSAWSNKVFNGINGFDTRMRWGAEDYDLNIRAVNKGFKGLFIKNAIVYHNDKSIISFYSWVRKQFKYHTGTTIVYLKNNVDFKNKRKTMQFDLCFYGLVDFGLKVLGFIRGNIIWWCIK